MSIDFPRGWQIARETPIDDHDPKCSFSICKGGLLCDCDVIYKHDEFKSVHFYGKDGRIFDREYSALMPPTFLDLNDECPLQPLCNQKTGILK